MTYDPIFGVGKKKGVTAMPPIHRKPPQGIGGAEPQFEPLMDSAEAASLLHIHPKTLQKLARAGTVIGIPVGKLWRFRASALNAWLARMAG